MTLQPRIATLATRAAALGNDVVALSRSLGREDLAGLVVDEAARWELHQAVVAVLGLPDGGVTSLVWALVGVPPPDGLPGGVVVDVVAADADRVVVHMADGTEQVGPPGQLAALLGRGEPEAVAVEVAGSALPPGIRVVDVPSAPGGFRAAVRTAALVADAVVVANDAATPLGSSEVSALEQEARRLGTVHLAVTKADRFRGAEQVAARSADAVRARDGELVLTSARAVSAHLAGAARDPAVGDDEARDLLAESGIAPLREALVDDLTGAVALVRLGNLLRVVTVALGELRRAVDDQRAVLRRPAEQRELRAAEVRAHQASFRDDLTTTLTAVSDGTTLLRESLGPRLQSVVVSVPREVEDAVASGADPDEVAAQVDGLLSAAESDLADWLGEGMSAVAATAAEGIDAQLGTTALRPTLSVEPGATSVPNADDAGVRLRVATAMSSGMSGLGMLAVVGTHVGGAADVFRVGTLGASVLVGLAVAARGVRHTRSQRDTARLRAEVRSRVEAWRTAAQSEARIALLRSQRELESAVRAAFDARRTTLADELAALSQPVGPSEADAAPGLESAAAALDDLARRTEEMRSAVSAARSGGPSDG